MRIRMTARATDEPHRAASQLELLFDLTFVIAIASLTARYAHALADGHALEELVPFLQVFFAIWWAWINFTWFASSFDTDDVPYRLLTMVQMAGVLVIAAGLPAALEHGDFGAVALGYVIMRLGLVAQWLRVAVDDPASRGLALRHAIGITIAQAAWVLWLGLDATSLLFFAGLVVLELAIPRWAERKRPGSWHPHHIAERYGLFTIILLGESVFAASTGVDRALAAGGVSAPLVAVAVSALALVFALWWLYFLQPAGDGLASHRDRSYLWGYGHYGIFAALAAVGAGLEVAVEHTGHHVAASPVAVGYADRGPGQRVPRPAVGAARPDRVPAGVPAHAAAGRRPGHPAAPARGELDHVVRRRRRDRRHLRLDRRDHPPGRFSGVRRSRARAARARAARPQLPRRRPSRSA